MSENIASREVQRRDDPFGIPACFYWTMDEVADWVESIGYGKYKENFRSNFINGRKLLTVDACVLPRMGITHFGDILKLCKHIRELLGIKRHLRDYNPWRRRDTYISMTPTSGKKQPHLSYREHANVVDRIVNARIEYFKKRSYCYVGWSMEKGWDKGIKQQKRGSKDATLTNVTDDSNKNIAGPSMQDKLRDAAEQLLSYDKEPAEWTPWPDVPTKAQLDRFRRPKLRKPFVSKSSMGRVLGQLNWSPVRGLPTPRSVTDLHVTGDLHTGDTKTIRSEKPTNVKLQAKETETKGKDKKANKRSPGKHSKESVTKREKEIRDDKTASQLTPAATENLPVVPAYRVSAMFHWKKMDTSTGYPPLRLDEHVKCGYYNVHTEAH